jgi:hypothetical protein
MRNRITRAFIALILALGIGMAGGALVAATPALAYSSCGASRFTMPNTQVIAADGQRVLQAPGYFYYGCGGVLAGRMIGHCVYLRVVFDATHETAAREVCSSQQVIINSNYWNGHLFTLQQTLDRSIDTRLAADGTMWYS